LKKIYPKLADKFDKIVKDWNERWTTI
jgi:hypothetical protein